MQRRGPARSAASTLNRIKCKEEFSLTVRGLQWTLTLKSQQVTDAFNAVRHQGRFPFARQRPTNQWPLLVFAQGTLAGPAPPWLCGGLRGRLSPQRLSWPPGPAAAAAAAAAAAMMVMEAEWPHRRETRKVLQVGGGVVNEGHLAPSSRCSARAPGLCNTSEEEGVSSTSKAGRSGS